MKILFVTPQSPWPPAQGAAIRNYHLMRGLARRHAVSLLTFDREVPRGHTAITRVPPLLGEVPLEALGLAPPPRRGAVDRLRTLVGTSLPDMARRLYGPELASLLRNMVLHGEYDWVQIEGIEMAPYAGEVLAAGPGRPRWLFDDHNAEFALQRSAFYGDLRRLPRPRAAAGALYSLLQWRRLMSYERHSALAADAVVAVSPADRAELLKLDRRIDVSTVPNGVDVAHWSPEAVAAEARELRERQAGPLLVFDGSMDFRPNVDAVAWFSGAIWPRIRLAHPEAGFAIVGRNPLPAVRALANLPGVTVTGAVPDTRPWVAAADVYVVPMRMGGGVRLKVLQALAMRRPLVSTPAGMQGVEARAGRDYLAARDEAAFAAAVIELLAVPERRGELGQAARRVAEKYAWEAIVPLLEQVLERPRPQSP